MSPEHHICSKTTRGEAQLWTSGTLSSPFSSFFNHVPIYRSVIPLTCRQPMPCKDQEGGNARRKFLISTKELLSPLTSQRAPPHLTLVLMSEHSRLSGTPGKRQETCSSPVSDKSNHTNVLASTFRNKKETLSPISEQQSKHVKQARFITIIRVIIIILLSIMIQYKPTWINYQK